MIHSPCDRFIIVFPSEMTVRYDSALMLLKADNVCMEYKENYESYAQPIQIETIANRVSLQNEIRIFLNTGTKCVSCCYATS